MTVTATFDPALARVRITATALGAADVATVERSTDGIRWTTVRGGSAAPVVAGALAVPVDDYEYPLEVGPVTYRVSGVETGAITYVGVGAAAAGNNASVTPAFPAALVVGDLLVTLASIRNSGTGTVNTPTGWTVMATSGNVTLLGRRYVSGDVAPLVTFAGGAANADTFAQTAAFRRAELAPLTSAVQLNGSAQNVAYPAITVSVAGCVVLLASWKQDDWTSVAPVAGFAEIGEVSATTGSDAGQVWDYVIQTVAANIAAGSFVVTGGAAAISRGLTVVVQHAAYLNQQTAAITLASQQVWIKSVARPFLNRAVDVVLPSRMAVQRPPRAGIFDVLGRTLPIAVSTVRGSRRWTMFIRTETALDAANTDLLLASGDPLYIQAPSASGVETGYVSVGEVVQECHPLRVLHKTFTLPLTEIAAPGPDVVGAVGTWATVLATYATWADVLAAYGSWADLLSLIGSPGDVIVP